MSLHTEGLLYPGLLPKILSFLELTEEQLRKINYFSRNWRPHSTSGSLECHFCLLAEQHCTEQRGHLNVERFSYKSTNRKRDEVRRNSLDFLGHSEGLAGLP
jgi:hypothetical protein